MSWVFRNKPSSHSKVKPCWVFCPEATWTENIATIDLALASLFLTFGHGIDSSTDMTDVIIPFCDQCRALAAVGLHATTTQPP